MPGWQRPPEGLCPCFRALLCVGMKVTQTQERTNVMSVICLASLKGVKQLVGLGRPPAS